MSRVSREGPLEQWVVRAADQRAADDAAYVSGIETDALMERAGAGAAEWILNHRSPGWTVVLAGPGGNGGDALVVARHLAEAGIEVQMIVVPSAETWSPAVDRMVTRFHSMGAEAWIGANGMQAWLAAIESADTVVDGLFGAGLTRALAEPYASLVRAINETRASVISLDLPSGLVSDRSQWPGEAVHADVTLAMAFLKPAHLFYPAAGCCGNVAMIPVGYPKAVLERVSPVARVLTENGVGWRLPRRQPDGHKGSFGRILVVAGSIGMTGAAMLTCQGALRAGAGLVTLACPRSLNPIFETALSEVLTLPYRDSDGRLSSEAVEACMGALDRMDSLVIGPGLSRAPETLRAVSEILRQSRVPAIIDADALMAFSADPGLWSTIRGRAVLTPHPGEFARMREMPVPPAGIERIDAAYRMATDHGIALLLKGRPTVIVDLAGRCFLNPTGNTGLAKGGSGDVLAGLVAGLAAGGGSLDDAALAAAYIHGSAADTYRIDRSERSMTPTDLLNMIPYTLKEIEP